MAAQWNNKSPFEGPSASHLQSQTDTSVSSRNNVGELTVAETKRPPFGLQTHMHKQSWRDYEPTEQPENRTRKRGLRKSHGSF